MAGLADLDATAQAALVRSGEASPRDLVTAAIERIEQRDAAINAVVRERFDAALREVDGDLPPGPFRGVPLLLKDAGCHVAGEPTYHGTTFLRDARWTAPVDSHLARLFRAAGFVVLGRTNVPELTSTVTTESVANGACRNPWDGSRTAGGSSGGSAAAVATGMAPVAHGTDGGGSIRVPASMCGVVGLRPTRGRVSFGPELGEVWGGASVAGVLTRTVRDTVALLDVISVPMAGDPYVAPPAYRPYGELAAMEPAPLRVGLCLGPSGTDPDCRDAVEQAGRLLAGFGHHVEVAEPAALAEPEVGLRFAMVIAVDISSELQRWERALGRAIDDSELEPRNVSYRSRARRTSAADYLDARHWLTAYARRLASWWADGHDVLVTPTLPGPPPTLGWFDAEGDVGESGRRVGEFIRYTRPFNVSGQPAISLPMHRTAAGLPVGVQLVGPFGREDVVLALAAQIEQAAPWSSGVGG